MLANLSCHGSSSVLIVQSCDVRLYLQCSKLFCFATFLIVLFVFFYLQWIKLCEKELQRNWNLKKMPISLSRQSNADKMAKSHLYLSGAPQQLRFTVISQCSGYRANYRHESNCFFPILTRRSVFNFMAGWLCRCPRQTGPVSARSAGRSRPDDQHDWQRRRHRLSQHMSGETWTVWHWLCGQRNGEWTNDARDRLAENVDV